MKGTVINVCSTIAEDLQHKIPRQDGLTHIQAAFVGEIIQQKDPLKHTAYVKSKEIQGLKALVDKFMKSKKVNRK